MPGMPVPPRSGWRIKRSTRCLDLSISTHSLSDRPHLTINHSFRSFRSLEHLSALRRRRLAALPVDRLSVLLLK